MNTICSILDAAAEAMPDKPLFVFPENRWRAAENLTYGELALRSAAAAAVIAEYAAAGERVLLLLPTGTAFWEAFFGCLTCGVIAVPLNIPNLNRPSEFLREVYRDCHPAILITDAATADLLRRRAERHPELNTLPIVTPDQWASERAESVVSVPDQAAVAFLQYTSGSTARPKGICISHSNLIANLTMIRDRMGIQTGEDVGVTWLPHYHDMGLVGSYLTTMFTGNTTWCLQPEDFALQPSRWLQLISEHHAGVCGSPDFAYRLCIGKTTDQQAAELDLSGWRVAYIGAERIRPETLREFAGKFGASGFRFSAFFPCYGLGETTLLACGGPPEAAPVIREVSTSALARGLIESAVSDEDRTGLAGSGQTFEGSNIVIVDSKTGECCGDDMVGEVFVSGPSVTCGYFQREDLNRQLFRDIVTGGVSERYLETGDLGFLSDGQLFITGRTREIIIIRGRNLSPEDIEERTGSAHQVLQPGATVAFSHELNGQELLIIASELRRSEPKPENPEPVFEAIRQAAVTGFGVNPSNILLMRPASIPRTSSGKLKRLEVREKYQNNTIDFLFREHPAS